MSKEGKWKENLCPFGPLTDASLATEHVALHVQTFGVAFVEDPTDMPSPWLAGSSSSFACSPGPARQRHSGIVFLLDPRRSLFRLFLSRPNPRAAAGPAVFPFLSLSLADVWARSVSTFFKLSPWSERHTPPRRFLACKSELPPPSIAAPPQTLAEPSPRFEPSSAFSPLQPRRQGSCEGRELAEPISPLSLTSSRLHELAVATEPPLVVASFLASSQAPNHRKPSSLALVSPNSCELPVKRRRAPSSQVAGPPDLDPTVEIRSNLTPYRSAQSNVPFEGDQDQVYEEEQPQCFEEGNHVRHPFSSSLIPTFIGDALRHRCVLARQPCARLPPASPFCSTSSATSLLLSLVRRNKLEQPPAAD
ncbi:hypothetical protein HU200_060829 [Digitaria exilis]|uniref:Uncharacterized protein n=1 Tax=Digitaria exilis TaxID=1010633 RepID=A0A835E196_9POAL|nr:hypothetical protein HU200_060829 [Digitaria exilis]